MQDKEAELDTLRKAGKNLRERLDEKEVETRGIMDRVRLPQGLDAAILRFKVVVLLSEPLVVYQEHDFYTCMPSLHDGPGEAPARVRRCDAEIESCYRSL